MVNRNTLNNYRNKRKVRRTSDNKLNRKKTMRGHRITYPEGWCDECGGKTVIKHFKTKCMNCGLETIEK